MKHRNLFRALLVIITLLSLNFTITNGFRFRKSEPGNFFGGTIWNQDSTGSAGLFILLGEGAETDTVKIYNTDSSFFIESEDKIIIKTSGNFLIGGEEFVGGFGSLIDSNRSTVVLAQYGTAMGKGGLGAFNFSLLGMGYAWGTDSLDTIPHFTQLEYHYDSVYTGFKHWAVDGGWYVNAFGQDALSVDTLYKFGVGTHSPRVSMDIVATDAIKIPVGITSERPNSSEEGYIRYNTDSNAVEYFNGIAWDALN